jgi:hypothetical protein
MIVAQYSKVYLVYLKPHVTITLLGCIDAACVHYLRQDITYQMQINPLAAHD